jgi:hypothetical protein
MTSTDQPIPFKPAFAFCSGTGTFSSTYFEAAPAEADAPADADAAADAEARAGCEDGEAELDVLGFGVHAVRRRRGIASGAKTNLFMSDREADIVPAMGARACPHRSSEA